MTKKFVWYPHKQTQQVSLGPDKSQKIDDNIWKKKCKFYIIPDNVKQLHVHKSQL